MTENEIFESLKSNMPAEYEKETAGFLTFDILKAVSVEDEKIYAVVKAVEEKLNPVNLAGDELTRECLYRRGIARKAATKAFVLLKIIGTGIIKAGDLFSTANDVKFAVIEDKTITIIGTVLAQCIEAGTVGMVGANTITQIPVTLTGITAVTNSAASYEGFNEETDDSLLERYLDDIQKPATSNNIYHFEKWAREIAGVGKVKVFPTWNGNNSVKVSVINDSMLPASTSLISEVQTYIDPIHFTKWGKGYGQSAIGSYCTVASGAAKTCNISVAITKSSNYTLEQIKTAIEKAVTAYFKDIAFHETINYVSFAKITSIIVEVDGVLDISNLTINAGVANIALGAEEVPVLGTVTVS